MNTFTLKVAALSLATVMNSQAADLTAKVPVDFKASGVSAAAGSYVIAVQRPGLVVVKKDVKNIAIAMLPVQTSTNPSNSTLTFSRRNGGYHLSGYCVAGSGCWSSAEALRAEEKIEIALMLPR